MLWQPNADMRPTFRQTLDKLNEIYPIKGELIDNLINMVTITSLYFYTVIEKKVPLSLNFDKIICQSIV